MTRPDGPIVVVRLMGGLGNQLFQYAAGRAYADRIGAQLFLDVGEFLRQGGERTLGLFHFAVDARIVCSDDAPGRHPDLAPGIPGLPRLRLVRERDGDAPDDRLVHGNGDIYLSGYWQHQAYFVGAADRLRREYTLVAGPRARLRNALALIDSLGETIAVHVRRGDYLGGHGALPASYYHEALATVRPAGSAVVPVLFSDDPQWVQEHLLPRLGGVALGDRVRLQDHEELMLMSACSHHVIANSSYSWWAAWLGHKPLQRVVYPEPWFAIAAPLAASPGWGPAQWQRISLREPFVLSSRPPTLPLGRPGTSWLDPLRALRFHAQRILSRRWDSFVLRRSTHNVFGNADQFLVARSRLAGLRNDGPTPASALSPSAKAQPRSAHLDSKTVARIGRPGTHRHIFLEFETCRESRILGQQLMLRHAEMRALGLGTKDYGQSVLAVRMLAKAGRVSRFVWWRVFRKRVGFGKG